MQDAFNLAAPTLKGLTIWPTPDGRWQVNTKFEESKGWRVEIVPASEIEAAICRLLAVDEMGFLD